MFSVVSCCGGLSVFRYRRSNRGSICRSMGFVRLHVFVPPLMVGTGHFELRNLDVGTGHALHFRTLQKYWYLRRTPTMAELRVLNSGKKSSSLQDAVAMTTQLVAGLEKIGLAMKSRTWRREGRAGLGPLQRQVLTLLRSKPGQRATVSTVANELAIRLPTASEVIATLERKQLVRRRRDTSDGR